MQENNELKKDELNIQELPKENNELNMTELPNEENKDNVQTVEYGQPNQPNEKITKIEENINKAVDAVLNPKDRTAEFGLDQIKYSKKYAFLCYIPFLVLYPYFTKRYKDNEYMKFHINQGIDLSVFTLVSFILDNALCNIFEEESTYGSFVPGWVSFFGFLVFTVVVIYSIFGIWTITKNKTMELPLIGKFKYLK